MKFTARIREPASFFYLLDSLSNWDPHTRAENKRYLLEKFKFGILDKFLLIRYTKLRKKYPWKQIDSDFILSEDFEEVETRLKRRLNESEFRLMKRIIKNFQEKFHSVFMDCKQLMINRTKLIEELIESYNLQRIVGEIANFYEVKINLKHIYIDLLANPSGKGGGGANVFPSDCIQIEPKELWNNNRENAKKDLAIIIHEIIHLTEKRISQKKWRAFEEKVKKEKINFTILREAIATSIAPEGYIATKYFLASNSLENEFTKNTKNKEKSLNAQIKNIAIKIYPLTKKQFEKKQTLFCGDYIDRCILIYKRINENDK